MAKTTYWWTFITAILTAIVYIDIFYFFSVSYITIPLAVISAIISMVVSFKQKQYVFIFLNLVFAFIAAVLTFILFP